MTLPQWSQSDREMNSWAIRSFRDVADADYISARLACRAHLPVQFLWASQQALEKYLKCILFLHRIEAKKVKHDIRVALKLVEESGLDLDLNEGSKSFIGEVADVGEYRYMEASFSVDWHHVILLDRTVWELRRLCTLAPEPRATKLVEGQWAPRVRIAGGYLEQVIKKRDHPARAPLLWQNAYFGRGRRTIRLRGGFISVNSPLLHTGHLIEEIRKLAYIPEGVVKAYRENVWKGAKAGKKR